MSFKMAKQVTDNGHWITKNGRKIFISDDPVEKRDREIAEQEKTTKQLTSDKNDTSEVALTTKQIQDALLDDSSYIRDKKYQDISRKSQEAFHKYIDIRERLEKLDEEIEKEKLGKKSDEEMTEDDEFYKLLWGTSPDKYTEKGEQLREERYALFKQYRDAEKEWTSLSDRLKKLDKAHIEEQRDAYKMRDNDTISKDVKDSYLGFKVGESTTPYVDEALKDGRAIIVEMSPRQYLQEVAHNVFKNATFETSIRGISPDNVQKYMKMIQQGVKFDTPYLNYKDSQQEGRHRAVAAHLLGIERIPVIVVLARR